MVEPEVVRRHVHGCEMRRGDPKTKGDSMKIKFLIGAGAVALVCSVVAGVKPVSAQAAGSWSYCSAQGGWCFFEKAKTVRYVLDGVITVKGMPDGRGGTACNGWEFNTLDGPNGYCEIYIPPSASETLNMSAAAYQQVLLFDREGTHGVAYNNPSGGSVGMPCGAPTDAPWVSTTNFEAVPDYVKDMSQISSWNQVYNACVGPNSRTNTWNARIEMSKMSTYVYFYSQPGWIEIENVETGGLAYAENFSGNTSTVPDKIGGSRDGYNSVRSGIWNAVAPGDTTPFAVGDAGGRHPDMVQVNFNDLGYNFHGFGNRLSINWSDVRAVVVTQAMRCIPADGVDYTDCNKGKYLANMGIDGFVPENKGFDNFVTQRALAFSRFKPVTNDWQFFTAYVGPKDFAGVGVPPAPNV